MGNAQTKAKRKYNKANYFRVSLMIPLDHAAPLKEYAEQHGTTVNKLLNDHITELLTGRNTGVTADVITNMRKLHEQELEFERWKAKKNVFDDLERKRNERDAHTSAEDTRTSIDDTATAKGEEENTCTSMESAVASKTPRRPPPTREMVELWDELNADGLSFDTIAKGSSGHGYGKSTVHKAVREYRREGSQ